MTAYPLAEEGVESVVVLLEEGFEDRGGEGGAVGGRLRDLQPLREVVEEGCVFVLGVGLLLFLAGGLGSFLAGGHSTMQL